MKIIEKGNFFFPDPMFTDTTDGILAVGGDLDPERVLFAYENGIFPWYDEGNEIYWWCPDPRFVLFPEKIKISTSMKKILNNKVFSFSENIAFSEVIENCKKIKRVGQSDSWITKETLVTYKKLHELGIAKSIEVWQKDILVGGFYGLEIGNIFCGESMFAKVSNASKAGFINFVVKNKNKYTLIDCQSYTEHLESLGAGMISKSEFLKIINQQI